MAEQNNTKPLTLNKNDYLIHSLALDKDLASIWYCVNEFDQKCGKKPCWRRS